MCSTCPFRQKGKSRQEILDGVFSDADGFCGWSPGECHCQQDTPCAGITDEEAERFAKKLFENALTSPENGR
jgi:hypothetical protein